VSVWAIAPSIRPNGGTLPTWKAAGYRVAVLRQGEPFPEADITIPTDRYLGWAKSINILAKVVLEQDTACDWVVNANDDTLPDPNHTPQEIADQCTAHFGGTFGVMQPTGDLALWPASRIDTFAGSPWMGREWCRRSFGGHGPVWDEFVHMHGDQHLWCCAVKLGIYWDLPDLIHQHNHCQRGNQHGAIGGDTVNLPGFLKEIYSAQHWNESTARFQRLQAGGFVEADNLLP